MAIDVSPTNVHSRRHCPGAEPTAPDCNAPTQDLAKYNGSTDPPWRRILPMTELLAKIIEAHGGLERWKNFSRVEATIVTDGALWGMKNLTQDQEPRRMTVWLHEERSSVAPFGDPDWHTDFTPDRIAILKSDNTVVAERNNPRASFAGHEMQSPWDPLHRAYFNGYALWTYLTTPFLLTIAGVQVEEIEPWTETGETWRVLRARFADTIATHSTVQDFFFGEDLLLRRHGYNVAVAGGFGAAQLVSDYIEADGVRMPSKRRAYRRGPDCHPHFDPLLVSIDISEVRFT
jgi:hypothetical protein